MSEIDPGAGKKWDWSSPQNIIALVGIAVSLAGSVFGVALALPFGQDLLCRNFRVSCPHVAVSSIQLDVSAIDFEGWCEDWRSKMRAETAPPPGFIDSPADCRLDFSASDPPGFSARIGGVKQSNGIVLVAHLSMQHPAIPSDIPFTLRAQCWRHDAQISMWVHTPCALSRPIIDGRPPVETPDASVYLDRQPEAQALPEGAIAAVLEKDALDYIARWRLDIAGETTSSIPTGDYRVEVAVGAPGESIEPQRVRADFNVYPPA